MSSQRKFSIKTPLTEDKLLIKSGKVRERLGQPFEIELELLSPDENLDFDALLGQEITISMALDDGVRHFHAFIANFSQLGRLGRYSTYHARAVPWLWFLTRTTDCFIFQTMSVPDIIKAVFREHGFTDIKDSLTKRYRVRDYCVQYRETDFNFIQRLMEEEGIYYYFQHEVSRHTLVLSDDYSAHQAFPGYVSIDYFPYSKNAQREADHIHDWHLSRNIQPGKYVVRDYDFTKPRVSLQSQYVQQRNVPKSEYEMYDYPGKYLTTAEGDHYAQSRLEAFQSGYETVRGAGNARGLAVGSLFKLKGYPRKDQNREYLVVAATHCLDAGEYEAGTGANVDDYTCSFEAMESKQPFRPAPTAFKTRVSGPQTATVVGPADEEIYTDKYARVKVKFHWDRDPNRNESSSCWVRVSQIWAGKNWGWMSIPRIGQEVVVDFLEGDPDQPLITGRVYNSDNMPPYDLPGSKTQSGIKTRSTKSGSADNFNEIRFEDLKGSEQLFIHAEKNQDIEVENDETHWVGHNRAKTIDNDETVQVKHDRTETVGNNETITIGKNRTESVGVDESITIGKNRSESVGENETITIAKDRRTGIGEDDALRIGRTLLIDVGEQITIRTGAASITMKHDGTISIKGNNISVNGSGRIAVKAASDVSIKGSKITEN